MNFPQLAQNFKNDESGAVTVDWVVLTAAIVGLGVAVLSSITAPVEDIAKSISTELNAVTIDTTMDGS